MAGRIYINVLPRCLDASIAVAVAVAAAVPPGANWRAYHTTTTIYYYYYYCYCTATHIIYIYIPMYIKAIELQSYMKRRGLVAIYIPTLYADL